uniref:Uncharacterized protein n=1 Tax=Romanomermis culicivorax TaxID=13658 RepID=A0A915K4F9_ROMCU
MELIWADERDEVSLSRKVVLSDDVLATRVKDDEAGDVFAVETFMAHIVLSGDVLATRVASVEDVTEDLPVVKLV